MPHPSLKRTEHRPYPLPQGPWAMSMQWLNLCFLHWPVPVKTLSPHIPEGLELDTFEGQAWLGVVPFEMRNVKPRFSPSIPWLSHFAELNVRTYVTANGKSGVWFFSLDAANPVAVRVARASFYLPYFDAKMSCISTGNAIHYHNLRTHKNAAKASFFGHYEPTGTSFLAEKHSLEAFLTERYCLYSADKQGNLYRGEIHHQAWPLQEARVSLDLNSMTEQLGFPLPDSQPITHFAKSLDVIAWLPGKL